MNGSSLSPAQLALTRSHSYGLFSQLFLQGLTAVLYPYLQEIPELTVVLPQPFDPDSAAAEYHDLFQFNIFAQESFFLNSSRLVGGEQSAVVQQFYDRHNFLPVPGDEADHLGQELAFLAFLAETEAEAHDGEEPLRASQYQFLQKTFMENHLLRWLVPCLLALKKQSNQFFSRVAQLTLSLTLTHYEEFSTVNRPFEFLPPANNILQRSKSGLKEIAQFLLSPPLSGIYLSRESIGLLGRQLELPRGFGNREQMLVNLMRTAVQYENLIPLLNVLQKKSKDWQSSYQGLLIDYPKTLPYILPWQERALATENILAEMMISSRPAD